MAIIIKHTPEDDTHYVRLDTTGQVVFSDALKTAFLETLHGQGELWFSKDETEMEEELWEVFKSYAQKTILEAHEQQTIHTRS